MPIVTFAALVALFGISEEHCVALSSPELRRQIKVVPQLEREVVLVPNSLTGEDVKALAWALHANTAAIGDEWRVFRSDATSSELRKADREWISAQVRASAKRAEALLEKYGRASVDAPYRAMQDGQARFEARRSNDVIDASGTAANELTPGARLLTGVLNQASPELFGEAAPGKTSVFSTSPVGPERSLVVPSEALDTYLAAQERFAAWSENALEAGRIPESYRWAFPTEGFRPGARTIQFYVSREGYLPSFGLQIYDSTGHREAGGSLTALGLEEILALKAPESEPVLGKVELPVESISPPSPPIDAAVRDPLDLTVRDALLLWGKAKGYDRVVACVPDDLFVAIARCRQGRLLDLDALTGALDRVGCEISTMGRILVLRPAHALQEEATRADRRPLSALLHAVSSGKFTLDDLCAYHAGYASLNSPPDIVQRVESSILAAYPTLRNSNWNAPHSLLATLGLLTPSERRTVAEGRRISIDTPRFAACREGLAWFASHFGVPSPSPNPVVTANTIVYTNTLARAVGTDLERSPSHLLARGGGGWIQGAPSMVNPLVRRVSRVPVKVVRFDSATGKPSTEEGVGVVVDSAPVSLGMVAAVSMPGEDPYQALDRNYRFFWLEERSIPIRAILGENAEVGPITLRDRGPESKTAVSLDQVPGATRLRSPR